MKKLLYIATLSMVVTLFFAAAAVAQEDPCPDPNFPRFTPDGCQASPLPDVVIPGGPAPAEPNVGGSVTGGQYETPEAPPAIPETPQAPETPEAQPLPHTGGASLALLLPAAGLLLGAGLLGLRVARRR